MRGALMVILIGAAWLHGYLWHTPVQPVQPVACPAPTAAMTEPERCMAWWFGAEYTSTHDKENLRRQVCGKR